MSIRSVDLISEGWVDYDTLIVMGRSESILDSYLDEISHLCISVQKEEGKNHLVCLVQEDISIFKSIIEEKGFDKKIAVFITEREVLELDSVLDKINSCGLENLNFRETQFLNAINTYSK